MKKQEIDELLEAGIIDSQKAKEIEAFFKDKKDEEPNRIFLLFGLLGALLVGLGLIAIVASNWDEFSKVTKSTFAFIPLLIAHSLCIYTLLKKFDSRTWKESCSSLLIFALGAGIILLSEIYQLKVNAEYYMLAWIVLSIPIVYIFESSMASLLCYIGIGIFTVEVNHRQISLDEFYYLFLMASLFPFYFKLIKEKPNGNFTNAHHLLVPIVLLICLFAHINKYEGTMPLIIIIFACLALMNARSAIFRGSHASKNRTLEFIGSLGLIGGVFFYSFYEFWKSSRLYTRSENHFFESPSFIILTSVFLIVLALLFYHKKKKTDLTILAFTFIPSFCAFFLGLLSPLLATIAFNIIGVLIGLCFIKDGSDKNHLGLLNAGLAILTGIIIFRFLDIDINFAWKGLVFILLGLGFFLTNYYLLKNRKLNE